MFGKYAFRVKANLVLNIRFNYDPMKLSREQTATWGQVVGDCYRANGRPVEAATLFMLVQVNMLSHEARGSDFVKRTFRVVEELKHEMTPAFHDVLRAWVAEFDAETVKQSSETDHETFMRHYVAA